MKKQQMVWDQLYRRGLAWKKTTINLDSVMKDKSVLELGAGNGKTLKAILEQNPKEVVAIDLSKEAIRKCKEIKSKKVNLIQADFLTLNTNKKFDVIVSYYFLNNFRIKEREKAVKRMRSILKEDGLILFEDFAIGDLREKGKEIERNTIEKTNGLICHFFEKEEVKELFRNFNLEIEEKKFNPIRKDKKIERRIIKAVARTR